MEAQTVWYWKSCSIITFSCKQKAYKFLKKTLFCQLFAISTLKRSVAAVNIQPAFSECILSGTTRDTLCHPMMLFAPWYLMKGALKKNYLQHWERPSRRYFRYFRQIKVYSLPCHHVSYPWPHSQLKKTCEILLVQRTYQVLLYSLLMEYTEKVRTAELRVECVIAHQGAYDRRVFTNSAGLQKWSLILNMAWARKFVFHMIHHIFLK